MFWRNNNLGPYVLGCAQLGMDYGIANLVGKPPRTVATQIVSCACLGGIVSFDTAQAYGDSQEVLGVALSSVGACQKARVITKFMPEEMGSLHDLRSAMKKSVSQLSVPKLFAVLSHRFIPVQSSIERGLQVFNELKQERLAEYFGVSVYSAKEALHALEFEGIDVVQMPLNVFDRQACFLGVIERAKRYDKLLLFRSVYLQGLLTLSPDQLPQDMGFAHESVCAWWQFCRERNLVPQKAALSIALFLSSGFPLVIGAETPRQVNDNLEWIKQVLSGANELGELVEASAPLAEKVSCQVVNPSLWKERQLNRSNPGINAGVH